MGLSWMDNPNEDYSYACCDCLDKIQLEELWPGHLCSCCAESHERCPCESSGVGG
jgi:hypothetical protein